MTTVEQREKAVDEVAKWLASKPLKRIGGKDTLTMKQHRSVTIEDRAKARDIVDLVLEAIHE